MKLKDIGEIDTNDIMESLAPFINILSVMLIVWFIVVVGGLFYLKVKIDKDTVKHEDSMKKLGLRK